MLLLTWVIALSAAVFLYFRQQYSRFSRYGVKNMKVIPLLGNMTKLVFKVHHFAEDIDMIYKAFPEEKFVGRFEFVKPTLIIKDIELIKKIGIKDFEYFLDHRGVMDEKVEPVFARNLLFLKGHEWKDMRSTLSPAFTSSKIRLMVPFMEEVGKQMMQALQKNIKENNTGSIEVDIKDLVSRFANDVIASCAFGLQVDSYLEKDNQFYKMGKTASTFSFRQMLMFLTYSTFPSLALKLKLAVFSKEIKNFFISMVLNTMNDRETRNIIRPDMIHLLIEAKKGKLTHDDKEVNIDAGFATVEESDVGKKTINRDWSDNDLVAQAMLFLLAGFETVSSAMTFALHELALSPDVQGRLASEIRENYVQSNGKLDYASIQNMQYLDMVISEVLRMWPPAVVLDRICVKDYNLGKPNDKATVDYIVRNGDIISVPSWSIHRDPEYFPNPEKFDPERFSDENKHLINPMTYTPFGIGPRNCIGSRFALCELKVMIYMVLLNMEISPCEKTCIPSRLSTDTFNLRLVGGHWLRFKSRH